MSETDEPLWLNLPEVERVHERSLETGGGADGVRDDGLLASAVERPRTLHAYGQATSLHELAAAYAEGISRNHAFVDGNKRTAFASAALFLKKNGLTITPPNDPRAHVEKIKALAQGQIERAAFAAYLQQNTRDRTNQDERSKAKRPMPEKSTQKPMPKPSRPPGQRRNGDPDRER